MKIIETKLDAVKIIQLDHHYDERGYFMEIYNESAFHLLGIDDVFVQDNYSFSDKRGTVRGLHYQKSKCAQSKLIRCAKGSIYDIAVDVRKKSPTFGKAVVVKLTEDDGKLVYIPHGFAHGVAIIDDQSAYSYKVDSLYDGTPENNGGLSCLYSAKELNLAALLPDTPLILSVRDTKGVSPDLEHLDTDFIYGENS